MKHCNHAGVTPAKVWLGLVGGALLPLAVCAGELGTPRDLTFTAKIDQTVQRYVLRLPPDFSAAESHHLMIALHGHGADRWQYATDKFGSAIAARKMAAKHGMIYVSPDYRAKTSWMGPKAEADMLQLIDILRDTYRIDRVFLVGESMGGSSVLTFTALHPDLVAGVCSCNGTANHLEYDHFQDAIRASFGGTKTEIPLEYKKRSAEYHPEAFTMPVAITAGGQDKSVPPDSVKRLAGILRKLDRKVLLILREEGGHSTTIDDATTALEFVIGHALGLVSAPPPEPVAEDGMLLYGRSPETLDAKGRVELGLRFSITKPGRINALRFYQARSETGSHTLRLWDSDGILQCSAEIPEKPGGGWRSVALPKPLGVRTGEMFTVSYTAGSHYVATEGVFPSPIVHDGIRREAGLYSFEDLGRLPSKIYKQMSYFVDVDYEPAVKSDDPERGTPK
ncbi:MAG: alpha/beta fold hydrolase [Lentisphaeria bacterium]|nr:alpha/beta fold hydrolase [Lentisphaeria bacterium]